MRKRERKKENPFWSPTKKAITIKRNKEVKCYSSSEFQVPGIVFKCPER